MQTSFDESKWCVSMDVSVPIDVSSIFLDISKTLIKFGIKDLSINSNCMECLVIFLNLLKIA